MFDLFSGWGLLFSYTPLVALMTGFLLMPVLLGSCYALLQQGLRPNNFEQQDQQRRTEPH